MISIIISGAGGQLGKACIAQLPFTEDFSVYTFDRNQLDIAEQDRIRATLDRLPHVKYWINCAAYTRVDDAETYIREATLSNVLAPGFIAEACKEHDVHLFHFSSDYVYHNDIRRPLKEDDPTTPVGIYARTKLEGEFEVRHTGASHTVLRTSWVYGPGGHNFVNTMLRLGKIKDEVSVVSDQLGCPTYTLDLAGAVKDLIRLHAAGHGERINGVFNYCGAGEVTWDEFARTIFQMSGSACKVKSISSADYGAAAPRPPYSVMDCSKISPLLSGPIPHWKASLARYLQSVS